MTKLPLIDLYTGQVPDKAKMDKDTFANSVHTYLNYFNDKFIPESRDWADKTNTLSDEMESNANTVESYMNTTESYMNTTESYKSDAENSMLQAKNWANANEDVEIETGMYSAKNWALKAQEAVAALPEGTLDDSVIASDKAWSSQKINDELNLKLDKSAIDSILSEAVLWTKF